MAASEGAAEGAIGAPAPKGATGAPAPEGATQTPALFYHLTNSTADQVLAKLLPRALSQGWRAAVLCANRPEAEALDRALWHGTPESFLPHGLAGGPHDAAQPVLLIPAEMGGDLSAFQVVISTGGVALNPSAAPKAERLWLLFDGQDPMAVDQARGHWRALTAAGVTCQYWTETDGRWNRAR